MGRFVAMTGVRLGLSACPLESHAVSVTSHLPLRCCAAAAVPVAVAALALPLQFWHPHRLPSMA